MEQAKASLPRCLTPNEREQSHLHDAAPRWCYARNLWPYLDHGPPETKGSSPPYGPPADVTGMKSYRFLGSLGPLVRTVRTALHADIESCRELALTSPIFPLD